MRALGELHARLSQSSQPATTDEDEIRLVLPFNSLVGNPTAVANLVPALHSNGPARPPPRHRATCSCAFRHASSCERIDLTSEFSGQVDVSLIKDIATANKPGANCSLEPAHSGVLAHRPRFTCSCAFGMFCQLLRLRVSRCLSTESVELSARRGRLSLAEGGLCRSHACCALTRKG